MYVRWCVSLSLSLSLCVCVCVCVFVCMCVCVVITFSRLWASTRYGCQSCLWSAEQGKWNFPCPRSHLRVWSRKLGSAVPSRVSLLILHTQAESGAYLRDSTPLSRFPLRFPLTVMRHRATLEFIRSRNCVTDDVHYRDPTQG